MADTIPLANLPEAPAYDARTTDAAFVVEVVVPFNEGTVEEARNAARDEIAQVTIDSIPGLREGLNEKTARAEAVLAALIFG